MAKTNTYLYNGAGIGSSQLLWKEKTYLARAPRKGKTSQLLFPHAICYSMSSYFGSVRKGLSQLLSPNPYCYNAELTMAKLDTQGCLPGKTIKALPIWKGHLLPDQQEKQDQWDSPVTDRYHMLCMLSTE